MNQNPGSCLPSSLAVEPDAPSLYHSLFDTSPDPIYVEAEDGTVLDANQAACRFQGLPREQLIGSNVLNLIPSSQRKRVERDFRRWMTGELTYYEGFTRKPDGSIIPVEVHGIRIDFGGRPAVILHVRDNSLLHRKQQDLALIFEHMISGCALHELITDDTGRPVNYRFLAVNQAFQKLVGKSADELIGYTVLEVFPQTEAHWIEVYGKVVQTGESIRFENYSRQLKRHFEVSAYSPESGKFVTVVHDVTERNTAMEVLKSQQERERQVLAAQKLESLGVLAGGIAHDFNNLLVGVLGNADLALLQMEAQHPARESIEQIRLAGQRASELSQLMLAYSGRARFHQGPVDIGAIARETRRLASLAISKKITVHLNLPETAPSVIGDAAQIRQLIMNLLTNAADAIGDRIRDIFVSTSVERLHPDSFATVREMPMIEAGDYLVIGIRDTGCGIEPDNLNRIFEPFYTSKFSGRGLGLAAALGIVKGHHGGIEVTSTVGVGTHFRIAFPVHSISKAPAAATQEELAVAPGNAVDQGVVLVVDDEPSVRQVIRRMLNRHGYAVEEANHGAHALELLRAMEERIKLVMLDLTMPVMSGEETLLAMQQQGHRVPVILMSGYSESEIAGRFSREQVVGFVEKPFDLKRLILLVEQVWGEKNRS